MAKVRKGRRASGNRPARKTPDTLLEHPARLHGDHVELDARRPENILAFANSWLVKRRINTKEAMQRIMRRDAEDRMAHEAAWLRAHSVAGLAIINSFPSQYRSELRKLWMHAFHAAARHETISVNLNYLSDVRVGRPRRTALPALARAGRKEKITVDQYKDALQKSGKSRKKLFGLLDMSPQGLRDYEERHPELTTKTK